MKTQLSLEGREKDYLKNYVVKSFNVVLAVKNYGEI